MASTSMQLKYMVKLTWLRKELARDRDSGGAPRRSGLQGHSALQAQAQVFAMTKAACAWLAAAVHREALLPTSTAFISRSTHSAHQTTSVFAIIQPEQDGRHR